jgi:hypothetical protein
MPLALLLAPDPPGVLKPYFFPFVYSVTPASESNCHAIQPARFGNFTPAVGWSR